MEQLAPVTKVQYSEAPEGIKLEPSEGWIASPFPEWPGGIIVHKRPTAGLMCAWYENLPSDGEAKSDTRHAPLKHYDQRKLFIKSWHIKGISEGMVAGDGRDLPDYRLLVWINTQLLGVLNDTRDPFGVLRKLLDDSES